MSISVTTNNPAPSSYGTNNNSNNIVITAKDDSRNVNVNNVDRIEFTPLTSSSQEVLQMSTSLLATMKTIAIEKAQQDPNFNGMAAVRSFDTLAEAYDRIQKNNSDTKKCDSIGNIPLDKAFTMIAEFLGRSSAGNIMSSFGIKFDNETRSAFIGSGEKQGTLFAETFLKNYKEHGMGAYGFAIDALMKMPATTSFSNISYNDFTILSANSKTNLLLWNKIFSDSFDITGISDFMNDFINQGYEIYKEQVKNQDFNSIV